jgi:hypothetical protein
LQRFPLRYRIRNARRIPTKGKLINPTILSETLVARKMRKSMYVRENKMLNPTILTTIFAILAVLALAMADWFVWGMAAGPRAYPPRLIQPLTARDLANKLMAGLGASNAEMLMVPENHGPCRG